MANRRMITSDLFEDDIIGSLPVTDRLLWVGLITIADDQGRTADNPALIRSKIFPYDEIPISEINDALLHLAETNRITRYQAGGKKCIQINNWWKHQRSQWAGKSNLPAPEGWTDRARYNSSDGITEINWKADGGYNTNPYTGVDGGVDGGVTTTPALTEVKLSKDKIKDKVKDKVKLSSGASENSNPYSDDDPFDKIQHEIEQSTGYLSTAKDVPAIREMVTIGATADDIHAAVAWFASQDKVARGAAGLLGAVTYQVGKRKQADVKAPSNGKRNAASDDYRRYLNDPEYQRAIQQQEAEL